ncbi:hypothetical protein D3C81_1399300 [compost metagenome]
MLTVIFTPTFFVSLGTVKAMGEVMVWFCAAAMAVKVLLPSSSCGVASPAARGLAGRSRAGGPAPSCVTLPAA